MTDSFAWIIGLGLAVVIAGIYLLSKQIANHLHDTARIAHHSNEMILAELERLTGAPAALSENTVAVVLEKRCAQRRRHLSQMSETARVANQRKSHGRRATDFPETATAGQPG